MTEPLERVPSEAPRPALVLHEEPRRVVDEDGPITFDEYLDRADKNDNLELHKGVMVERMAAQIDHEKLFAWLFRVLGTYVTERDLGIVLGSRAAVEIDQYNGRLPDILFVRRERLDIVREKAIYGPPDFIIELVSPGNRPSDLNELETDYRTLGVEEIWFVDRRKRRVRSLRKRGGWYEQTEYTEGSVRSETVEGFEVPLADLFDEPRPSELATVLGLLKMS